MLLLLKFMQYSLTIINITHLVTASKKLVICFDEIFTNKTTRTLDASWQINRIERFGSKVHKSKAWFTLVT